MAIPVNEKGHCVLSEQVGEEKTSDDRPKNWKYRELCKARQNRKLMKY